MQMVKLVNLEYEINGLFLPRDLFNKIVFCIKTVAMPKHVVFRGAGLVILGLAPGTDCYKALWGTV